MSAIDDDVKQYDSEIHHDLTVDVGTQERTNVALRLSTGEDLLVSLIDCGDHLSIDLTAYTATKADLPFEAWTMDTGSASERVHGPLLIAIVER